MKNNGKTEANKKNIDDSIWNFEIEWDNSDIKLDLTEVEFPAIDIGWSVDDYIWDTKINSEDNVKEGGKNRETIVREQAKNRQFVVKKGGIVEIN